MKSITYEMDKILFRHFDRLEFFDPRPCLIKLRNIEIELVGADLPDEIRTLRTRVLGRDRELREAAIFCYLKGQREGRTIFMADDVAQDYDFVVSWIEGTSYKYAPVQIKELVPAYTNRNADLKDIISGLSKYSTSENLIVAVHLNRQIHFDPPMVVVPQLPVGELWIFGSVSDDQSQWALWGDFLDSPKGTCCEYPIA